MKQITRAIYVVDAGETVTFEIQATKVGNFATILIDGDMLKPVPGSNPPVCSFTVSVGPGLTHFGILSCFFPKDAPDDARFQLFLSGSAGGGRFTGSDVEKGDPVWKRGFELRRL